MATKLIILIVLGVVVLGVLVWQLNRAWRYRKKHPDEIYWPYIKEMNDKK